MAKRWKYQISSLDGDELSGEIFNAVFSNIAAEQAASFNKAALELEDGDKVSVAVALAGSEEWEWFSVEIRYEAKFLAQKIEVQS